MCRFQLCKKSVGTDEIWHPSYEIRHVNALYKLGTGVGAMVWFLMELRCVLCPSTLMDVDRGRN